ncbi:RNA polymerase recycling motor HelD [Terrihalobacillus insolitus]|uniref:RNA polymerase recycling motor HelD n=1 Tax=Terrihalobacillus insolitus TaxID=2950438 RepID=UPI0023426BC2|nr:RNA polymerase recycling motor HelD [Terrihalobacillus insolitus]MDC3414363.1 UvrD-helicase domain-containing protein [Terrihalobacillus insolitus]
MGNENEDRKEEQAYLTSVLSVIKTKLVFLQERIGGLKDRVIDLRKNFWEDVTVNIDEPDDVIETQASLKQQAELLSERERNHGQVSKQIKTLHRLKDSPYFGRIDFLDQNEKKPEKIYIGIGALMDQKEDDFLVYDWRAPISSLYYDYPPGLAKYETVEGTIEGEVKLKRQFIIRQGELKGMFDTGVTIGDHLLQSVLGDNATATMKSIVATIQREQNQIIRNEKSKLLIVQGVAGSGKTSAALQRVAYLLYRYRETITAENVLLFSPNPLFNSYVATVLPELGEENMRQGTLYDYLHHRLGSQLRIESPFDQMEYFLTAKKDDHYQSRIEGVTYKAGLSYRKLIDQFVQHLSKQGLRFKNITFRGEILIPKTDIAAYFYRLDTRQSIPTRMEHVAEWIRNSLNEREQEEREKAWVTEEVGFLDKEEFLNVHQELQKGYRFNEDTFDDFSREEEMLKKRLVERKFKPLKRKVMQLRFVDIKATFIQLLDNWNEQNMVEGSLPENWLFLKENTRAHLLNNELPWEDATAYLYFFDQLVGSHVNKTVSHVFIDEAQDYSPFQFAYLKLIFPRARFTLLGDYNQAIYAHALREDTLLSGGLEDQHERITLTRSYRSTKPIVEFTKDLIAGGQDIEAFNRDGAKPVLYQLESVVTKQERIVEVVQGYQEKGYQTIAIIGKSMKECQQIYQALKDKLPVQLLTEETFTFQLGLLILPAYLAKGIEFDAVIIYDASKHNYGEELERNLFYTACTRAMHELSLFAIGEPSLFIQEVDPDKYEKKQ